MTVSLPIGTAVSHRRFGTGTVCARPASVRRSAPPVTWVQFPNEPAPIFLVTCTLTAL